MLSIVRISIAFITLSASTTAFRPPPDRFPAARRAGNNEKRH
jgi:hypothetical protein